MAPVLSLISLSFLQLFLIYSLHFFSWCTKHSSPQGIVRYLKLSTYIPYRILPRGNSLLQGFFCFIVSYIFLSICIQKCAQATLYIFLHTLQTAFLFYFYCLVGMTLYPCIWTNAYAWAEKVTTTCVLPMGFSLALVWSSSVTRKRQIVFKLYKAWDWEISRSVKCLSHKQ